MLNCLYIFVGKTCQAVTEQKRENDLSFDGSNESNPLQSNVCQKVLSSKGNLKQHKEVHNGERKHVCTICGRIFTYKSVLKVHMATHSDEKPYKCSICTPDKQKCFKRKDNLYQHMKVHNEKKYSCNVCEQKFRTLENLKRHRQSHTNS